MHAFFVALLRERCGAPGNDLVGLLLQAEEAGQVRAGAELLAQCAMLLFAGYETTRNLLGNGLQTLLHHRDQWQLLLREPHRMGDAVRELLRYDTRCSTPADGWPATWSCTIGVCAAATWSLRSLPPPTATPAAAAGRTVAAVEWHCSLSRAGTAVGAPREHVSIVA